MTNIPTIHRRKLTANYTVLPNALLRDKSLSFKARGILAFMLSHVDGWEATAEWLAGQALEGREAIRSGLSELEAAGYVTYASVRDVRGVIVQHVWNWHDYPVHESEKTNRTHWQGPPQNFKKNEGGQDTASRMMAEPNYGNPNPGLPNPGNPPTQKEQSTKKPDEEVPQGSPSPPAPHGSKGKDKAPEPEPEKPDPTPKIKILELWNRCVPSLRQVLSVSGSKREKNLRARWREMPDLKEWEELFKKIESSDFLCGRVIEKGKRPFTADFDWVLCPSNFVKIREGKYTTKAATPSEPETKKKGGFFASLKPDPTQ